MASKMKYPLYQTFNNIKLPKNNLSKIQQQHFIDVAKTLVEKQKVAFIRLIIEHALINDEKFGQFIEEYIKQYENIENPDDMDMCLPYEISCVDDGLSFNIKKFPIDLRWILWKFLAVCESDTNV